MFGGRLAIAQTVAGSIALLVTSTLAVGGPVWLDQLFATRPLEADAASAGVPYLVFATAKVVVGVAAALLYAGAASLIVWRKRRNVFATLVAVVLILRIPGFVTDVAHLGADIPSWAGPALFARSLDGAGALLFLLIFPSGAFVPSRAAWLWAAWAAWVFGTIATPRYSPVVNLDEAWAALAVTLLAVTGLIAQIYRYRSAATAHERLQTKWIVYGLAVYVSVFAVQQLVPIAVPQVRDPGAARFWYRLVGDTANNAAATLLPLTIAIAILRSRLLGIDLIINRTLVYLGVTAVLAGAFAGLSTAAQYVLGEVTGHGSDALSIVIAIGVGAAFAPVKTYVQRVVDRRLRHPGAA